MDLVKALEEKHMKKRIPDIRPGDTVRVHHKIVEKGKEKIQIFEGVVLSYKKRQGTSASIRVRKISMGIGVECTFLIHSPKVTKIEVIKRAKVRRAKLYYLRNLKGKAARLKNKEFDSLIVNVKEEEKKELKEAKGIEGQEEIKRQEELEEESSRQDNKGDKKDEEQKTETNQPADDQPKAEDMKQKGGNKEDKPEGNREKSDEKDEKSG